MKTNAFSPGTAWMSSNTFSSVSNRVSPSSGSGTCTVFGTWFSFWSRWLWVGLRLYGWAKGVARPRRPCLTMAAWHRLEHERPEAPRQPPVDRREQHEEEPPLDAF